MGIGEQIEVEPLSPSHVRVRQNEVITIRPEYTQGTRYYTCPFCANLKFLNSFRLRKHMTEEHPDKRILVLDHSQLEAVASSDIQLVVDTQEEGGDITGKRSLNLQGGQTVLTYPRKRQKRVIFDPSDGGFHRFVSAEENVDDPLSMEADPNQVTNQEDQPPPVHNILVHGRDHCGVCCLEVETNQAGHVDQLQVAGQTYRAIINVSLGFEVDSSSTAVCTECENLTTSIGHTRIELLRLQKKLNEAVSRLRDLYQRGQALLEADLEEGGLTERSTCIRIVNDLTQPQREARNLGFTLGQSFHGCIVNERNAKKDDGSQVKSLNLHENRGQQEEVSCLFLTQEEWASSGLTVLDGQVQVPETLVAGLAIGASRPKFLLSQGVCTDLAQYSYLCLDCDASFNRLTELMSHAESHDPEFRRQNDDNIYMGQQLSPYATQENEETVGNKDENDSLLKIEQSPTKLSVKLTKARMYHQEATEQDVRGSRREFRAFMHKSQFKECENEVPSLDKPFQCGECNKCFESAMELWGHQNSFGTQTFDCNFGNCKEIFEKLGEFAVHYAGHAGQSLTIPGDAEGKRGLNIPCPVCNTIVTGLYKLQRHKMKHDPELKYKCPACPKQFVKANTMRRHINSIHKGEKYQLKCHLCEIKISNRETLTQHLREVHAVSPSEESLPLTCLKCALVCSSIEELRLHETGHLAPSSVPGVPAMLTSRAVQNNTDNSITRPEENMLIAVGGSTVRLATSATSVAASQQQHITLARLDAGQEEVGAQEQQLRINLNQREGIVMTGDHSGRNIEFHRRYNPEDSPSNQIISTVQTHRKCVKCNEKFVDQAYLHHVLELEKTGSCDSQQSDRELCPECSQQIAQGQSVSEHLMSVHETGVPRFQCSECEIRLITLQGCRRHYRQMHRGTPITCIICKETFSSDGVFHEHLASNHQQILGPPPVNNGEQAVCRYCGGKFMLYQELVIHIRFNHLLETIDISSTELEEVTMIGGHVVEFSEDGGQIVALHTIP